MTSYDIKEQIHIPGEYGFCFTNSYSYSKSVIVAFEYDMHLDQSSQGALKKRIEADKRQFILAKIAAHKPRIVTDSNDLEKLETKDEVEDPNVLNEVQVREL